MRSIIFIREARESISDFRSRESKIRDLPIAFREAAEHIVPNGLVRFEMVITARIVPASRTCLSSSLASDRKLSETPPSTRTQRRLASS
jgi:hypothetical protein